MKLSLKDYIIVKSESIFQEEKKSNTHVKSFFLLSKKLENSEFCSVIDNYPVLKP